MFWDTPLAYVCIYSSECTRTQTIQRPLKDLKLFRRWTCWSLGRNRSFFALRCFTGSDGSTQLTGVVKPLWQMVLKRHQHQSADGSHLLQLKRASVGMQQRAERRAGEKIKHLSAITTTKSACMQDNMCGFLSHLLNKQTGAEQQTRAVPASPWTH